MKQIHGILVAAGVATCASPTLAADLWVTTTVQVSDLIGLTEAQAREALGVLPAHQSYLDRITLDDDIETRVLTTSDLTAPGGSCDTQPYISVNVLGSAVFHQESGRSARPLFAFRDGRLAGVLHPESEVAAEDSAIIKVGCRPESGEFRGGLAETVFLGPIFLAFHATRLSQIAQRARANDALGQLRLGEPPPGGLAGYRARPPTSVTVEDQPDNSVRLIVRLTAETGPPDVVNVTVRDGRVVGIERSGLRQLRHCVLTSERAMRCSALAFR